MQCPKCGGRGRVNGTINFGNTVQRYRRCPLCDHRWKTWEEKDPAKVRAKKHSAKPKDGDLFEQIKEKV